MQAVAGLLHKHFPDATSMQIGLWGSTFLYLQHLQQAQTPITAQDEKRAQKAHCEIVMHDYSATDLLCMCRW